LTANTDKEGRFTLDRGPPGKAAVALGVHTGQSQFGTTHSGFTQMQKIDVKAGETAQVTIGGTGRPVVGRVNVPAELTGKFSWADVSASVSSRADFHPPALPEDYDQMDQAARTKFQQEWAKSPEYQAYRKAMGDRRYFTVKVEPDGSFRCDDVPAGD